MIETIDESFARSLLDVAREQAEKSWSEGGIPIGAALAFENGDIVSRGHNLRIQSEDPTAHAEIVCIRNAGRRRDWSRLVMATTLSPCPMCSGTACLLQIGHVVIGENRTFQGAEHWLEEHGIRTTVLDDQECIMLMDRMQREKPDLWLEDIGR